MARLVGKAARIIAVSRSGAAVPGANQCVAFDRLDDIIPLPADTIVINLAAQRYDAGRFALAQSDILTANVEIINTVYRFCIQRGLHEVRTASSVAVYEAGLPILDDTAPIELNAAPHPGESFYAWSKRWGEISAGLHRDRFNISTVLFRLSNPYGPHDSVRSRSRPCFACFCHAGADASNSFVIKGSPLVERDFIYVDDVCSVFETSLEWKGKTTAMNLCAGRVVTLYELAETIFAVLGDKRPIVADDTEIRGVAARRPTNTTVGEATGKKKLHAAERRPRSNSCMVCRCARQTKPLT